MKLTTHLYNIFLKITFMGKVNSFKFLHHLIPFFQLALAIIKTNHATHDLAHRLNIVLYGLVDDKSVIKINPIIKYIHQKLILLFIITTTNSHICQQLYILVMTTTFQLGDMFITGSKHRDPPSVLFPSCIQITCSFLLLVDGSTPGNLP